MRVDLLSFQQKALGQLRLKLNSAISIYSNERLPQILSFTAPTGAGKTIIMAALVESVFNGDDLYIHERKGVASFPEMRDCVFLWLSDSPELNEQSKAKFDLKADRLQFGQCVIIDDSFKGERLEDGHIYFLNTQKLGVNSNLTKHSDGRQHTIWEVLSKTVEEKRERFITIIDEAHRGAQGQNASRAQTIMQKFIMGSPGEIPIMPIVIGMSATIQRFQALAGKTDSTTHPIRVSNDDVRASGLLKDRIILKYPEDDGSNRKVAVLQAAATEWKSKVEHWNLFCQEQHHAHVKPIFIVQVENGTKDVLTTTNLDDCVLKIEEATGYRFEKGEVIHTFGQTSETLRANGLEIPYLEPSKISDDMKVKVVFFKENLSTGWDCPRAETMVSFKHAQDSTYIAQLLGRVIRTPIHARVTTDPTLNDVYLFLPFFDEETVDGIVNALNSDENGVIPDIYEEPLSGGDIKFATVRSDNEGKEIPLVVKLQPEDEGEGLFADNDWDDESESSETTHDDSDNNTDDNIYPIVWKAPDPKKETTPKATTPAATSTPRKKGPKVMKYNRQSIIKAINEMGLTTYKVREIKMETYFACYMNLSALLSRIGLYQNAKFDAQKEVAEMIHKYADDLRSCGKYDDLSKNIRSFKLHSRYYDAYGNHIEKSDSVSLYSDDSNLDLQFRAADAVLGRKGIADMYGKLYATDDDETSYMIDVILFANDSSAIEELNILSKKRFLELHKKYRTVIANNYPENVTTEYKKIVSNSDEITEHAYHLPLDVSYVSDPAGKECSDHLYVSSTTGTIRIKLGSGWEEKLLDEERKDTGNFLCWIRNMPRKEWSLAIPYVMNGVKKTAYPDFIIIKKNDLTGISVDILEPHDGTRTDNLPKAKGFVKYAKDNMVVNSIQLIRQLPDKTTGEPTLKRLDLSDFEVQQKIELANSDEDLVRIFEEKGYVAKYNNLIKLEDTGV